MSGLPIIWWTDGPVFKFGRGERDADGSLFRKDLPPGAAQITHWATGGYTFSFVCPCGCGAASQISLHKEDGGHGWKWNGDNQKPTLTPSIQRTSGCRWHGYVTNGEFVNV